MSQTTPFTSPLMAFEEAEYMVAETGVPHVIRRDGKAMYRVYPDNNNNRRNVVYRLSPNQGIAA